jgi:hypothetical protein
VVPRTGPKLLLKFQTMTKVVVNKDEKIILKISQADVKHLQGLYDGL